jgi:hypothetical protein
VVLMQMEDPFSPLPKQVGRGPLGKGVAAASTTAIAAGLGPVGPLAAGLSAAIQAFGDKVNSRVAARDQMLVESIATAADLDVETTLAKLSQDSDLLILTAQAVEAARRTRMQQKVLALGRALAAILEDDAQIDLEALWIPILARVEAPHLRILRQFLSEVPEPALGGRWVTGDKQQLRNVATAAHVGGLIFPLAQDLVQIGALHDVDNEGGLRTVPDNRSPLDTYYRAGPLALELFDRLHAAGEQERAVDAG